MTQTKLHAFLHAIGALLCNPNYEPKYWPPVTNRFGKPTISSEEFKSLKKSKRKNI